MALKFNPFENPVTKAKSKQSNYRVFDDPTREETRSDLPMEMVGETDYKQITKRSQAMR
jgi:hypothetical protein